MNLLFQLLLAVVFSGFFAPCFSRLRAGELVTDNVPPSLTRIQQILDLTPDEASRKLPVKLHCIVTYYHNPRGGPRMLFVQDETAGIFVTGATPALEVGQVINLSGFTDPGEFAPRVSTPSVEILTVGSLPVAKIKSFEDLITGEQDCQWVEVRGIVRSADIKGTQVLLDLASGSGRLTAKIVPDEMQDFAKLVDSVVRVRGVCTTLFNKRRQLLGVEIYTRGSQLSVEEAAPSAPYDGPESPANNLMQFSRGGRFGHRVKISGVVTFQQPNHALYIRGNAGAVFVQTSDAARVQPGDRVEVLGFPAPGEFSATLQDSTFRRIGPGPPVQPLQVRISDVLNGKYDADLVEVEGLLVEEVRSGSQRIFTVQTRNFVFSALLEDSNRECPAFVNQSKLRLTAICSVDAGNQWARPQSFRLIARSPADIVLLEKPSWWTLSHLIWMLSLAIITAMVGLGWVVVVSRKNMALSEHRRIQKEILEISGREQRRIGQDLHDGVCQQLGAIAFLTKILEEDLSAGSPEQAGAVRDISKHLAEAIAATRSVAKGLFPVKIEDNGLASALEELASNTSRLFKVECLFKCSTQVSLSQNDVALHLYYIACEAVNNAVKHAAPRTIVICLEQDPRLLRLVVSNDGPPFQGNNTESRGMGLQIMKYRAQTIGADFSIRTNSGSGCEVTCSLQFPS